MGISILIVNMCLGVSCLRQMKKRKCFLTLMGVKISQGRLIADLLKSLKVHSFGYFYNSFWLCGGWGWGVDMEALRPLKPAGWGRLCLGWAGGTGTGINGIKCKEILGAD